jgi:hypothetical protein
MPKPYSQDLRMRVVEAQLKVGHRGVRLRNSMGSAPAW